jgi:DNA-binding transcriptional MerR regulator
MSNEEKLFYTISEAAERVGVKPYVLRYWETEFKKLNPQKSTTGQRTYRKRDIQVALTIKRLLYEDKYTIAGAIQKLEEAEKKGYDPLQGGEGPREPGEPSEGPDQPSQPGPETPVSKIAPEKVAELENLLSNTKDILKKYDLT